MTRGSLFKGIILFSVPLMFSNLMQIFFNMADLAVVGRFAGAIALGSVGSTTILVSLYTGILLGISSGVNSVVALFAGAGNTDSVRKTVSTSFVISLVSGFLLMGIGMIFAPSILEMLNTKQELIGGAILYLRIYLLGAPALSIFNYGNGVLSAVGDTRRPLRYLSIAGIINIVLNVIFVIFLKRSVDGVAVASVIAQYISAILIFRCLILEDGDYALHLSDVFTRQGRMSYISRRVAAQVLGIGIPSAIQYSLFAFANLFVQTSINSFDHVVVEGHSAASNADIVVYDMMAAFYTACTSFIAQNFGAGNKKRIMHSYLITTFYSFVIGLVLGGTFMLCSRQFLSVFTNESEVIYWGRAKLYVMGLSYCLSAFMDNATAAARGIGKSVAPTFMVIGGSVVFRILWLVTVFPLFHTTQSIYLLYPVSWIVTAIPENIYFFMCYKKLKFSEPS